MFCRKCGAQLNDDEKFCYNCGTPRADQKEGESIRKRPIRPAILLAGILVLILAVVLFVIFIIGSTERKYSRQLKLAERYLAELDYDQAILAYRGAIKIDPKKEEAYLALAKIYEESGNLDAAEEILEEGYEQTENREIEEYLQRIQEIKAKADDKDPDRDSDNEHEEDTIVEKIEQEWVELEPDGFSEAGSLSAFLEQYSISMSEYDHDRSPEYDLIEDIVDFSSCCVYRYPYSGESSDDQYQYEDDPLGWFSQGGYDVYYEDEVDWILLNIFNCSRADINRMKEDWSDQQKDTHGYKYLLDGKYYYPLGGMDWIPRVNLVDIKEKDDHYRVVYETHYYEMGGYEDVHLSFYEADMEWKLIDGKRYWSIYTDNVIDESREGEEWLTDWLCSDNGGGTDVTAEEVVQAYAESIDNYGYYDKEYKVYCIYLDDDLIPEAIYDYGAGQDALLLSYNGYSVRATVIDRDSFCYFEKQNLLIEERIYKGIQTISAKRIRNGQISIIGQWAATEESIDGLWGYRKVGQSGYDRMKERYFGEVKGTGTHNRADTIGRSSKMGDLEAVTTAWEDLKGRSK